MKLRTRKKNRLSGYDYSKEGCYFVTICTHRRRKIFGTIENDQMNLNNYGLIARDIWIKIPEYFSNIETDQFIIMPNHIHGIINIVGDADLPVGGADLPVRGADLRPLRSKMLLSKIIHGVKSSISREIRKQSTNNKIIWQRSFYDHVIRNDESLEKIREYILYNPVGVADLRPVRNNNRTKIHAEE